MEVRCNDGSFDVDNGIDLPCLSNGGVRVGSQQPEGTHSIEWLMDNLETQAPTKDNTSTNLIFAVMILAVGYIAYKQLKNK